MFKKRNRQQKSRDNFQKFHLSQQRNVPMPLQIFGTTSKQYLHLSSLYFLSKYDHMSSMLQQYGVQCTKKTQWYLKIYKGELLEW